MPFSNRPYENDHRQTDERRPFRTLTNFNRIARGNSNGNGGSAPPARHDTTNPENFYYPKQMNSKSPMVIVMNDGEQIRGCIEWYDRTCLKVNRDGAPNLLIQKHWIKYLFKEDEL